MRLVIDANIVFAALIKESKTRELVFDPRLELIAPFTLWEELEEHHEILLEKTQNTQEEFEELIGILRRHILTIPKEQLQNQAEKIIGFVPDVGDTYYLATAMIFKIPLWSNDKQIQSFHPVQVLSSHELAHYLGAKSSS